jgi:y4mF family transcriptional regulator
MDIMSLFPSKKIGGLIKKRRKSLRLTQQQLGDLSGCGVAYVYLLEHGKSRIRLDKLLDVLSVLGLQLKLESGKRGMVVDEGDVL